MIRVRLLERDTDFDPKVPERFGVEDLETDLELGRLWDAMADGDDFIRSVVRTVVLHPLEDPDAIRYRQDALQDCLRSPERIVELYDLTIQAREAGKDDLLFGIGRTSPDGMLRRSVRILEKQLPVLSALQDWVDANADAFPAEAFQRFFRTLRRDLDAAYLGRLSHLLRELELRNGVLVSAHLGPLGAVAAPVLRTPREENRRFLSRIPLARPTRSYTIPERDQAGYDALAALRDRCLDDVANASAQAVDHVLGFFTTLRAEVAFFLGAIALAHGLEAMHIDLTVPVVDSSGPFEAQGLVDPSLALRTGTAPVPADVRLGTARLLVITGANRGGKSTLLRALGVAQLMAQAGLLVPARSFRAPCFHAVYTHWSREEDASLEHGKFDEELVRMSRIADVLRPGDLVLSNESFASTNESEGSEIGQQVLTAFLDAGVHVRMVTHLFDLASRLERDRRDAVFLRAPRTTAGRRTFHLEPGSPLPTSFGADLFDAAFGTDLSGQHAPADRPAEAS